MALNRIEAWLRIRDRARFSKDAREAAHDIRNIGDAADRANSPLRKFGGALTQLSGGLPQVFGRTRIFGFAVGTVATALIAAIPIVVGVGGALVAVASSASLAVIAFGALSIAAGGVLAVPLVGLTMVLAGVVNSFKKVKTALDAYRLAVHSFGKDSKQADTAAKRLAGTVEMFGGPRMLQAVKTVQSITSQFKKQTTPAMHVLGGLMAGALQILDKMMPVITTVINQAAIAISGPLKQIGMWIASPIVAVGLRTLGDAFALLAGPLIRAAGFMLQGFFALAVRLSPLLAPIAVGIEKMASGFATWAGTADFGPMIAHLQSWWNLMKSVGALLWEIIKVAAPFGKILVDALTGIVNKWTAWMRTSAGQKSMKKFFSDAINFTKGFVVGIAKVVGWIFKFGRAALPPLIKAFGAVKEIWNEYLKGLKSGMPFFQNVLIPLLKGLVVGVLGSLIGALKVIIAIWQKYMVVLGFVGSKLGWAKGIFEFVGKVIGFVFGGEILKAISLLGRFSAVLRPVAFAARLLYQPIRLVGVALGFVLRMGGRLIGWAVGFVPKIVSPIRRALSTMLSSIALFAPKMFDAGVKLFTKFKDGILRVIGAGIGFAGDIGRKIADWLNANTPLGDKVHIGIPGPAPDIDFTLPALASGGVVSGTGSWITGEAGPELNTLQNGRVTVQPLPAIQAPSATAAVHPGGGKRTIVTKVYLRGRQIAEAVADEAEEQKAAR